MRRTAFIFDGDGTLLEFRPDARPEQWMAPGYALTLSPISSMVGLLKELNKTADVFIISKCVSGQAGLDKTEAFRRLGIVERERPEEPVTRFFYPIYGQEKKVDCVRKIKKAYGYMPDDRMIFLDDHSPELWEMDRESFNDPFLPIIIPVKVENGLVTDHSSDPGHRRWNGFRISTATRPELNAVLLRALAETKEPVRI